MPSFSEMFERTMGKPVKYKNHELIRVDKFPVSNGDELILSIESTNSEDIQGVSIDITGSCKVGQNLHKKGKNVNMVFWEDAELVEPKHIELTVYTKSDFVWVQNIWEVIDHMGRISTSSGHTGAAMIVEEIENGRRYRCNDWHPDENFDDIIFTVKRVS